MSDWLKKGVLFIFINGLVFVIWVFFLQRVEGDYHNWNTDSNLLIIPEHQRFDLLVFGTSRGRALSRWKNHLLMESILNMRILNLSKTGGGGPVWTRIFLDYFYHRHNTADRILYFIDPWVLFSSAWNEDLCSAMLAEEPFRYRFFLDAIAAKIRWPCLVMHLRGYLTRKWRFDLDESGNPADNRLRRIDPFAVGERIRGLYPDGVHKQVYDRYIRIVGTIIQRVNAMGGRIIFILPPTLLGEEPGTSYLRQALKSFADTDGIPWYDFSDVLTEPRYFSDHDHLNSKGVAYFATRCLLPVLGADNR